MCRSRHEASGAVRITAGSAGLSRAVADGGMRGCRPRALRRRTLPPGVRDEMGMRHRAWRCPWEGSAVVLHPTAISSRRRPMRPVRAMLIGGVWGRDMRWASSAACGRAGAGPGASPPGARAAPARSRGTSCRTGDARDPCGRRLDDREGHRGGAPRGDQPQARPRRGRGRGPRGGPGRQVAPPGHARGIVAPERPPRRAPHPQPLIGALLIKGWGVAFNQTCV